MRVQTIVSFTVGCSKTYQIVQPVVLVDTKGTTTIVRKTGVLTLGKKKKKGGKKNDASQNVVEENSTLAVDDTNLRRIPALVI